MATCEGKTRCKNGSQGREENGGQHRQYAGVSNFFINLLMERYTLKFYKRRKSAVITTETKNKIKIKNGMFLKKW